MSLLNFSIVYIHLFVQCTISSEYSIVHQRAKKVMSDSPGLVDFAIGLVIYVLNLPNGQLLFFGEIQITEGLSSILTTKKGFGAS